MFYNNQFAARDPKAAAERQMDKYVAEWGIMLDTCPLMHDAAPLFFSHLASRLQSYRKQVMVPTAVIAELSKLAGDGTNSEKSKKAARGLQILVHLLQMGLLKKVGYDKDHFADGTILSYLQRICADGNVLLVTQDKNLGRDVLRMNQYRLGGMHKIHVRQVNRYGYFSPIRLPFQAQTGGFPQEGLMHSARQDAVLLAHMPASPWNSVSF